MAKVTRSHWYMIDNPTSVVVALQCIANTNIRQHYHEHEQVDFISHATHERSLRRSFSRQIDYSVLTTKILHRIILLYVMF